MLFRGQPDVLHRAFGFGISFTVHPLCFGTADRITRRISTIGGIMDLLAFAPDPHQDSRWAKHSSLQPFSCDFSDRIGRSLVTPRLGDWRQLSDYRWGPTWGPDLGSQVGITGAYIPNKRNAGSSRLRAEARTARSNTRAPVRWIRFRIGFLRPEQSWVKIICRVVGFPFHLSSGSATAISTTI